MNPHPDEFGGSDEESHYMSQQSAKSMKYKELTQEQIGIAASAGRVLQNWYVIMVDGNPTAIIQQKDIAKEVMDKHYQGGVIEPWPMQIKG